MSWEGAEQMMRHIEWLSSALVLYEERGLAALRAHIGETVEGGQVGDILCTLIAAYAEKTHKLSEATDS